jgi:hypothetical protein
MAMASRQRQSSAIAWYSGTHSCPGFFTSKLAKVTHYLYRATQDVAKAATTSAKNEQSIDRAYVKLSHTPEGMYPDATGMFHVRMRAHNSGGTPADITKMMVKPVLLLNSKKLPTKPDYRRAQTEQHRAFLFAKGEVYFGETFSVPKEKLAGIQNGTRRTANSGNPRALGQGPMLRSRGRCLSRVRATLMSSAPDAGRAEVF